MNSNGVNFPIILNIHQVNIKSRLTHLHIQANKCKLMNNTGSHLHISKPEWIRYGNKLINSIRLNSRLGIWFDWNLTNWNEIELCISGHCMDSFGVLRRRVKVGAAWREEEGGGTELGGWVERVAARGRGTALLLSLSLSPMEISAPLTGSFSVLVNHPMRSVDLIWLPAHLHVLICMFGVTRVKRPCDRTNNISIGNY